MILRLRLAGWREERPPLLSFANAEKVGQELHDRWALLAGQAPPFGRDDLAWSDIAQFVVRRARDIGRVGLPDKGLWG
jgi:hypothetical protein